eukprot:COSAG06_NODE_9599_length_1861_cov_1.034620_2_plen_92_part_00
MDVSSPIEAHVALLVDSPIEYASVHTLLTVIIGWFLLCVVSCCCRKIQSRGAAGRTEAKQKTKKNKTTDEASQASAVTHNPLEQQDATDES